MSTRQVPPPVIVGGFGPKMAELAGDLGSSARVDGRRLVAKLPQPDAVGGII